MESDLSIASLVWNASWLVKFVMLLLLGASLASWTLIFGKRRAIMRARRAAEDFEDRFWASEDLAVLYQRITGGRARPEGMEKIFEAGFKEYARLRKREGVATMDIVEGAQRAMRVAQGREMEGLEANLPVLATIGSVSPYVGLFGTVWGIMNSFQALGNQHQATLAMVAPGISEALVATAMGLFAAIPAVVAYNRYMSDVDRLYNRYELFMEEFASILQRQAHH
jgi:biopolymer transport protein TolQ